MKRLLFLLLLLPALAGAKVPDEADIQARIGDPDSPYYYPNLRLRYDEADPTLTADDYYYLYYGYAYQPQYRPLDPDPALDKIYNVMSRIELDRPARADLEELVRYSHESLARDPFSPQVLNFLAYAYSSLGDEEQADACQRRMQRVLATIQDSGDGRTEKSPRHILMFQHALDLLAADGLPYRDARVVSRTVEYIPLMQKVDGVKGYYFDFSRIYWNKPADTTYERPKTWRFNNLRIHER